eukprot:13077807-Alexandrium_andersonii.AAC.1
MSWRGRGQNTAGASLHATPPAPHLHPGGLGLSLWLGAPSAKALQQGHLGLCFAEPHAPWAA